MKLLFDQNISFRIERLLPELTFGESCHVKSVGLFNKDDVEIWQYAQRNGFTIVTFDADFSDLLTVKGFPPKVVWLRTGNLTTSELADLLAYNFLKINTFLTDPERGCLELF